MLYWLRRSKWIAPRSLPTSGSNASGPGFDDAAHTAFTARSTSARFHVSLALDPDETFVMRLAGMPPRGRELARWQRSRHSDTDRGIDMSMAAYFPHLLETERARLSRIDEELAAEERGRRCEISKRGMKAEEPR